MFHFITPEKPKSCMNCPLKTSVTRDCGQVVQATRCESSGTWFNKVPDKRCKLKQMATPKVKFRKEIE